MHFNHIDNALTSRIMRYIVAYIYSVTLHVRGTKTQVVSPMRVRVFSHSWASFPFLVMFLFQCYLVLVCDLACGQYMEEL